MIEGLIDQLWLIISILCGFIIALRFTKNALNMAEFLDSQEANKKLRAQLARMQKRPDVENIDTSDINSVIGAIAPSLPAWLQPLAHNPQVIQAITKNPDVVKGLLGKLGVNPQAQQQDTNNSLSL